ncbi:error-prone DNA polymerase [uncultured Castellaniella sp.]|uniref:error-prone DNA polymerase n=1 Tax=uncultured Castellaniella sp. TaxID=647907 RepID=UPI00261F8694|nr:error-prone DNA polymerase [uncultured Castellaniella sp.]
MAILPDYAELQCASNFSFLEGASTAEDLVGRAARLGYSALAITDECSLAGVVRAHVAAKQSGLPLIVGATFRLADPDALTITALARDRDGYGNLCELISLARMRSPKGEYCLTRRDLALPDPLSPGHLSGLPGCWIILSPEYPADETVLDEQIRWAKAAFGARLRVALTLHAQALDDIHRGRVMRAAASHGVPLAATGWPVMHARSCKPLQDVMTAIRLGKTVHECGYALQPNAERHLRSRLRLARLYPAEAMAETVRMARDCHFSLDQLRYEYPEELVPAGVSPATWLRQETLKGARRRFPQGVPPSVREQIERELQLIADLRYEAYFLTVYDVVQYARSRDILCQGRGSAANSTVCYCLGITEVDPARSSLLFERFISRERNEPPDIDVDFEHQRREEVMQYLYRKYGRHRAALTAAVATYRARGALRDVGKALGAPADVIDRVARHYRRFDGRVDLWQRLADVGLDVGEDGGTDAGAGSGSGAGLSAEARRNRQWAALADSLQGYPRHLSQHSGGFVISRGPLTRLVPVENAAMDGRTVVQWDKDDIEALGILKIDILALGMLSMLHRALNLMSERHGRPFALPDIPPEDPQTYAMLSRGDTIGVFQVESRAQMAMLPRLRPRNFYDLVVQIAIVRPGPMQGGMVHPYLRRREKKEPVTFPSDALKQALARTLGVPIFQEQVMQVAMLAAGYSAGEADALRRAMAAWKRHGNMEIHHDRLVSGMLARGYDRDFAEDIFAQIRGFGEYGFPESHAASFALLAYASAWLRCHEPAVFLAALLNSQPMGFYTPAQLVQDARRRGVRVLPVDVTVSQWDSTLEDAEPQSVPEDGGGPQGMAQLVDPTRSAAPAVRLGFSRIAGMRPEAGDRIARARSRKAFADVADLAHRAQLDRHDLQALARAGALRPLAGGNRRAALWQAAAAVPDRDLLRGTARDDADPALPLPTEGQAISADYRALGLTLGRHPVALLRDRLQADHLQSAAQLAGLRNRQLARACGLVTVRQRPQTAKGVVFMTLEDETGPVNVILWPDIFKKYRREALDAPLLAVYGIWQTDGRVHHLVARRLADRSALLAQALSGLQTPSRDFC